MRNTKRPALPSNLELAEYILFLYMNLFNLNPVKAISPDINILVKGGTIDITINLSEYE